MSVTEVGWTYTFLKHERVQIKYKRYDCHRSTESSEQERRNFATRYDSY